MSRRVATVRRIAQRIVALATLVCPLVHGCTEVDGGAVEVSWDLRSSDGTDTDCAPAGVGGIELAWDVAGGTRGTAVFPCASARGVTVFEVDEGQAALQVRPVCVDQTPAIPGSYLAPAPIVRTVVTGEVVTLSTQVIEVRLSGCTETTPCVCR